MAVDILAVMGIYALEDERVEENCDADEIEEEGKSKDEAEDIFVIGRS